MSIHAAFSAKARKKEGLINAVRKQASDQGLEVQEGEEGLNQDREGETGSFAGRSHVGSIPIQVRHGVNVGN